MWKRIRIWYRKPKFYRNQTRCCINIAAGVCSTRSFWCYRRGHSVDWFWKQSDHYENIFVAMTHYFWYNIMWKAMRKWCHFLFHFVRVLYETYGATWMWWRSYICGSIESVPDAAVSRCSCQMSAANTDVCGWSSLAFIIFAGFFWSGSSDFVSFCATTGGWWLWSGQAERGMYGSVKSFFLTRKKYIIVIIADTIFVHDFLRCLVIQAVWWSCCTAITILIKKQNIK